MKPFRLTIRKKTLVPTKHKIKHEWRSDWITVAKVDYDMCCQLFKPINGTGKCSSDAQFCKIILDNYGTGIYSVIAFHKGRRGFYSFMKVQINPTTFQRLQSNITPEQKEKQKLMVEYNRIKKQYDACQDEVEKNDLKEQMDDMAEELDLSKEIIQLEKGKNGPAPYLHSILPVYQEHEYIAENIVKQPRIISEEQKKAKQQDKEDKQKEKAEYIPTQTEVLDSMF